MCTDCLFHVGYIELHKTEMSSIFLLIFAALSSRVWEWMKKGGLIWYMWVPTGKSIWAPQPMIDLTAHANHLWVSEPQSWWQQPALFVTYSLQIWSWCPGFYFGTAHTQSAPPQLGYNYIVVVGGYHFTLFYLYVSSKLQHGSATIFFCGEILIFTTDKRKYYI